MENASKALLIAGGVMLTMLVVSLLLYAWTSVSEYQANLDKIKEVEELAEFNSQFTNYQRDDVQGYELLSLVNKVIDYNQRFSEEFDDDDTAAGNSAQYRPITVKITIYHKGATDTSGDERVSKEELKRKLTTTLKIPVKNRKSVQKPTILQLKKN